MLRLPVNQELEWRAHINAIIKHTFQLNDHYPAQYLLHSCEKSTFVELFSEQDTLVLEIYGLLRLDIISQGSLSSALKTSEQESKPSVDHPGV